MNSYREMIWKQGFDAVFNDVLGQDCPYRSGWQRDAWFEGFHEGHKQRPIMVALLNRLYAGDDTCTSSS